MNASRRERTLRVSDRRVKPETFNMPTTKRKPSGSRRFARPGGSTAPAWRKNFVKCTCLHPGCPRTSLLERKYLEPYVPKATVEIRSDCPWHEKEGMKAYPENYYDAQGRELDWETGKPAR